MKASNLNSNLLISSTVIILCSACAKMTFTPVQNQEASAVTAPPTQAPPSTPVSKTIFSSETVGYGNKQVDFLLVLDDSNSMLPDLKKLAARLSTFVDSLESSKIDWQMCLTTTRGFVQGSSVKWGIPLDWYSYQPYQGTPSYVLKKGTPDLNSIFVSTVNNLTIGGPNSSDERGIKAAHDNFKDSANYNCYRPGAALSVIVISDEDERSVGGNEKNLKQADGPDTYQPLEPEDYPQALVTQAHEVFGDDVRFTFNSIIVKPDDKSCESIQDEDTSPSHPGNMYAETSRLTDGGIGSICDSDFNSSLNSFKNKIVNSMSTLTLQCEPDLSTLKVKVQDIPLTGFKLNGKILKFSYALIEGTQIDLSYECQNKNSSTKK
ncbi:MAG: hypothetical protein ACXVCY_09080 [Pseudobdellovibrionaceae bacterium]